MATFNLSFCCNLQPLTATILNRFASDVETIIL